MARRAGEKSDAAVVFSGRDGWELSGWWVKDYHGGDNEILGDVKFVGKWPKGLGKRAKSGIAVDVGGSGSLGRIINRKSLHRLSG